MEHRDGLTPITTTDAFVKAFAHLPESWELNESSRQGILSFVNTDPKARGRFFCAVTALVLQRTGRYFNMDRWRNAAAEAQIGNEVAEMVVQSNDNNSTDDPKSSAELRKLLLERFPRRRLPLRTFQRTFPST